MILLDYIGTSLLLMRIKPVRSALSLLGIYIGVLALVIILSIHATARRQMADLYRTDSARVFIVTPGFDNASGKMGSLTLDGVQEVERIPGVLSALPRLSNEWDARSVTNTARAQILGVDAGFVPVYRVLLRQGRNFLEQEIGTRQAVCLLTESMARKLFPFQSAVGKTIDIQGNSFEIIGVVVWDANLTQRTFTGNTPDILIPVPWLIQAQNFQRIYQLEVRMDAHIVSEKAIAEMKQVLSHGDKKQMPLYSIESLEDFLQGAVETSEKLMRSLLAIAGISLLVGAIGVANVMLTSVTERTREIGLRKALGAQRKDILLQFLVEASVLTTSGGLSAVISGIIGITLFPTLTHNTASLQIAKVPIAICLMITVLIGLIAGVYPASHAASLSPAEALRYE